jgi:two-component system repressor protein LuxO
MRVGAEARGGEIAARILVVDGDAVARAALSEALSAELAIPPMLDGVASGRAAAERLRAARYDALLVDLDSLADLSPAADDAVARLVRLAAGALVLALSGAGSVTVAMAAMRAGAHDYTVRPVGGRAVAERLADMADRHGGGARLALRPADAGLATRFSGFVGASSQMLVVYEQIERIAASEAPVFITGEPGTGKDLCAEALHQRGPRAGGRYVALDCGQLARHLLEAELFGVSHGALSGTDTDRKGAAELADGGTLYLAEIDALDQSLQGKLLRFLQTGTMSRIGETASRQAQVRVICGTSRNPTQLIAERAFREDLFYRLHVLPIHLPPLRQRGTDAALLARHFLAQFGAAENKVFTGFSAAALASIGAEDWPGNVRQLETLIRRIAVMYPGGEVDERMLAAADFDGPSVTMGVAAELPRRPVILPMWQQEQRIIEDAIHSFGGNIALAAQALELSPSTIYRKRQAWAEMDGSRGAA